MPRSSKEPLDDEPLSLFQILGPSSSTCGYCSPSGQRSKTKSSKSYGIWAHQLSCRTYKALIDRGWRRSGSYLYKPNMRDTCCPQYTIRLEASKFKPSKSQRSIINKFNTFIQEGGREGQEGYGPLDGTAASTSQLPDIKGKGKFKGKNVQTFDLVDSIHASEYSARAAQAAAHRFEVTLEPASFSLEKFRLYKKYQMQVHGDKESKVSEDGFRRFLCDSPLKLEKSSSPSQHYGSFHQLYRLDGKLIAIGVLDILPNAVSAVYFIYDPDWSALSLGKISALRECALAIELERQGFGTMYYMMGYYIHSCQKMRYKADYAPSFLLDPQTYDFLPFAKCKPLLDKDDHTIFSDWKDSHVRDSEEALVVECNNLQYSNDEVSNNVNDDHQEKSTNMDNLDSDENDSEDEDERCLSRPLPPGFLDPEDLPRSLIRQVYTFEGGSLCPIELSSAWSSNTSSLKLREGIAAMGTAAAETCLFA